MNQTAAANPKFEHFARETATSTTADPESRRFMSIIKETPVSRRSPTGRQLFANMSLPKNDIVTKMSDSIRSKLTEQIREQRDMATLNARALPKVPKSYEVPVQSHLEKGKMMPICSNETHNKATNNGYSRNSLGGFFCH